MAFPQLDLYDTMFAEPDPAELDPMTGTPRRPPVAPMPQMLPPPIVPVQQTLPPGVRPAPPIPPPLPPRGRGVYFPPGTSGTVHPPGTVTPPVQYGPDGKPLPEHLQPKTPVPGGPPGSVAGPGTQDDLTRDRFKAIQERDRKLLEDHDKIIVPLSQRRMMLEEMKAVMAEPGFTSGRWDEWSQPFREALRGTGILTPDQEKATDAQSLFNAYSKRLATTLREAGSGAMSDKDLVVFQQSVPSLGLSTAVNHRMIRSMTNAVEHLQRVQQVRYDWWLHTGSLKGVDGALKGLGLNRLYAEPASKDEYDKLDPGALYINPKGRLKEKGAEDEYQ